MTLDLQNLTEPFSLKRRVSNGKTLPLKTFGFKNETDTLTDVLLGSPAHLRHLSTSSLSRKHLREAPCNIQVAQAQHAELVSAYEHFNVKIHMIEPEPELPMQVYSRDSSVMTPYGPIITAMANWWRRGENYAAIRAYQALGIPIYDMVTAGTFEGGDFNVIELPLINATFVLISIPVPAVKAFGTFNTERVSLDNSIVEVSAASVFNIVP